MAKSVAVDAAHDASGGNVTTLSTGVRARLVPVATGLLEDVRSRIVEPKPPVWKNPEKEGAEEINYGDPNYQAALDEATRKRGQAMMETMLVFGVQLVDPIPPDREWLPQLKLLEKHGLIDLSGYAMDDELEREFIYKRYVAVTGNDYQQLATICGVTAAGVEAAEDSFRNN